MTLQQAINRLYFRIENGMPKANENDLEAVNTIVDWVNEMQKKTIAENIPFTKMYVCLFTNYLVFYKDLKIAQKELHRVLETPTKQLYYDFLNNLNNQELEMFYENLGIEVKHPATQSEDEKKDAMQKFQENKELFLKHSFGLREFEEVRQNLNIQVSLAFNKYQLKK